MSDDTTTTTTSIDNIVWNDISLFGGAISCQLPMGYMDISNLRQVPDHQECYMEVHLGDNNDDDNNNEDPPASVFIIEILEQPQDIDQDHIIEYLFHDLAESNGISEENDNTPGDDHDNEARIMFFQSDESDDTTQELDIRPNELFNLDETNNVSSNDGVIYRSGRGIQRIHRGKGNRGNLETISIQMFVIRLSQYNTDLLITLTTPIRTDSTNATMLQEQQKKQRMLFQPMISSIQIHDLTLFNP